MTLAPDSDLGVLLTLALAKFKDRLHAHLAVAGFDDLGASYGYVFRTLAERPHNLAELAGRLGITPQGALKIVADMVDGGYVQRHDDRSDRRVRWLSLTDRGRDALAAARSFHAQTEREVTELCGSGEVSSARRVLAAIAARDGVLRTTSSGVRPF